MKVIYTYTLHVLLICISVLIMKVICKTCDVFVYLTKILFREMLHTIAQYGNKYRRDRLINVRRDGKSTLKTART